MTSIREYNYMNISGIDLIDRGFAFAERTAVIDETGEYSYSALLDFSENIAAHLLRGRGDINEERVCFLVPPGFLYASVKWGIWRAGGISVPLCMFHPERELEYTVNDCNAGVLVVHPEYADRLYGISRRYDIRLITTDEFSTKIKADLPRVNENRRAMILYTSGTTTNPKGVVTTHHNIKSQIASLVEAWEWNQNDYILNTLPLHHLHGILNLFLCPLWSGARCEILGRFDEQRVWEIIGSKSLTLFMGVPTMYYKLIEHWEKLDSEKRKELSERSERLRLMVSGSAALPVKTLEKWRDITGHTLLERYGMTEIGMAISNPLHGERIPGSVGKPLPGVRVELVDEVSDRITGSNEPGEIMVKGDNVFRGYWNRPDETKKAFTNGWFKTGDIADRDEKGNYRILGRDSVDIIKSGGYKISALEIEEILRSHPKLKECCVVGVPDEKWGERVAACLVPCGKEIKDPQEIREWARDKMAVYKIPTLYVVADSLPRNILGKVLKNRVKELF